MHEVQIPRSPHSHSHSHLRPQVPHHLPCGPDDVRRRHRASQLWLAESFIPLIFVLMTGGAKKDKGTTSWPPPKLPPLLVKIKSAAAARISCFEQSACQLSDTLQDPSKIKFYTVVFLMRLTSGIYASTFNQTLSFAILIIIINNMIITTIINISIIIIGLLYELYS